MGGAPTIVWLRTGVGYREDAAASMARLERDLGRRHDCNSSYRDYNKQMAWHLASVAYRNGTGPYPGHSWAMHPDGSDHTAGIGDDSDDWTTPGYIALAAEHGWIRTHANDPTERHHFQYQPGRDKHRGEGWPAGVGGAIDIPREEDDMFNDEDRKALFYARDKAEASAEGVWNGGTNLDEGEFQQFKYGILPIVAYSQAFTAAQLAALTAAVSALAGGQAIDYARIEKAAQTGAENAVKEWAQTPKA